ncbi:hydrolase [Azospirillum sp. A39]|uniref:hydrolase n=1 Tax=Azospirillum sp. A39 TaxID=3462279 RepID=UPI004045D057
MLLSSRDSALLVVDVQERLLPAVSGGGALVRNVGILLQAAAILSVPVLASEHYPAGLGRTVPELRRLLPDGAVIEKIHFACSHEPGFADRLAGLGRRQVVIAGAEAHVCVMQTALALRAAGHEVFVVADATGSRAPANAELAIARLRAAGVVVVATEMVLFEWAGCGGTPAFKSLLALIR